MHLHFWMFSYDGVSQMFSNNPTRSQVEQKKKKPSKVYLNKILYFSFYKSLHLRIKNKNSITYVEWHYNNIIIILINNPFLAACLPHQL